MAPSVIDFLIFLFPDIWLVSKRLQFLDSSYLLLLSLPNSIKHQWCGWHGYVSYVSPRYALWSSRNWLIFPSYQGFGAWTPNKLGEETRFPVLNSHHEIQSDSFSNQFFPSNNHHFAQEHSPRKWAVLNVAQDGEFGGAPPPRGGPAPAWGAGFTLCTWTVISNIAMDYDGH